MLVRFNVNIFWKILSILFLIATIFGLIILYQTKGDYYLIKIIIVVIIVLFATSTSFFYKIELLNDIFALSMYNLRNVKIKYTDITHITKVFLFFPMTFITYYKNGKGTFLPILNLKNEYLMIKTVLEKNPKIMINSWVARKLEKKFKESFTQYVDPYL